MPDEEDEFNTVNSSQADALTHMHSDENAAAAAGPDTSQSAENILQSALRTAAKSRHAGMGIASLNAEEFSIMDAIGGIRGVIESLLPGLIFIVAFVATKNLGFTVGIAILGALIQLLARIVQRQSVMGALSGMLAVGLCLVWAWLTKDPRNYYLPGFITNAVWIVVLLVSMLLKVPGIGLFIEFIRHPVLSGFATWLHDWRKDVPLFRAYMKVTGLWIALFAARLLVQLPMYLTNHVAWLGTARLVMGVPLFAVIIWVSWLLVADPLHRHMHLHPEADKERTSTIGE